MESSTPAGYLIAVTVFDANLGSGNSWSPRPSTVALAASASRVVRAIRFSIPSSLRDRKSTRLNSSHSQISYAVFCLKKKKIQPHATCTVSSPYCASNIRFLRYYNYILSTSYHSVTLSLTHHFQSASDTHLPPATLIV